MLKDPESTRSEKVYQSKLKYELSKAEWSPVGEIDEFRYAKSLVVRYLPRKMSWVWPNLCWGSTFLQISKQHLLKKEEVS